MKACVRRGTQPIAQVRIGDKRREHPHRCVDIPQWHQDALRAVTHYLAAARNVGRHDQSTRGRGAIGFMSAVRSHNRIGRS